MDNPLERTLNNLVDKHNRLAKVVENSVQAQQRLLAKQSAQGFQDLLIRTTAETYRGASAYTQLVTIGGYAVFFAIWNGLQKSLPAWSVVLSAMFIGLSATGFVFYEVFKAAWVANHLRRNRETIERLGKPEIAGDPNRLTEELERYKLDVDRADVVNSRTWVWAFWPTTIFGLAGVGVLFTGAALSLWHLYF